MKNDNKNTMNQNAELKPITKELTFCVYDPSTEVDFCPKELEQYIRCENGIILPKGWALTQNNFEDIIESCFNDDYGSYFFEGEVDEVISEFDGITFGDGFEHLYKNYIRDKILTSHSAYGKDYKVLKRQYGGATLDEIDECIEMRNAVFVNRMLDASLNALKTNGYDMDENPKFLRDLATMIFERYGSDKENDSMSKVA